MGVPGPSHSLHMTIKGQNSFCHTWVTLVSLACSLHSEGGGGGPGGGGSSCFLTGFVLEVTQITSAHILSERFHSVATPHARESGRIILVAGKRFYRSCLLVSFGWESQCPQRPSDLFLWNTRFPTSHKQKKKILKRLFLVTFPCVQIMGHARCWSCLS